MLKKLIGLLILLPSLACASSFIEGRDFISIPNPQPIEEVKKGPKVTEFFSYGCPWCARINPPLSQWVSAMGKNVQFEQVPVVFKPTWNLYAKAYYTAKTLALSDKLSPILFKTIQEDKKPLDTPAAMVQFFVAHGVDREIALSAFERSLTIDMKVSDGMALMAKYQISAVPAFVVNNKYKTDLQMAGSPERLFEILNFLIRK